MGTRGAYGFRLNKKDYITYNHFDSYPSGLGNEILEAARQIARTPNITREQVADIVLVNDDKKPTKAQIKKLEKYLDTNVDGGGKDITWYQLLRNAQGNLLVALETGYMIDSAGFLKDSLFCEWAYIVNLDELMLEVYTGFNKDPKAPGRYAALQNDGEECYGVKLVAAFPLNDLPKDLDFLEETVERS